tara:strand:+ start:652 stop:1806 length:1155 start_codon:yes stop_codon:yes gene_type:complete
MERIIFINQETGPLLIDMVNVFAKKNVEVFLYTGEVIKTYAELDNKVKIRGLRRYKKNNNFIRIITWSVFFFQALIFLILDLKKDTKVWISSNPPFAPWLNLFFSNITYVHVYDVYPNALLALPYIKKESFIYRMFLFFNTIALKRANKIFTPSSGMKRMLISAVEEEKVIVIPWWADTEFIKPIKKEDNKFIIDNNLQGKFIVMYSGNFGLTHNLEKLLDTALALKDNNDVKIVIIGDGPKKRVVDTFEDNYKLENLLVLPFQDEEMLPYSLASSDISIVLDSFASQGQESTASIPSKTYYLMAAGSVIYAESDETSELNDLINTYELGICDSSGGTEELVRFIELCQEDEDQFKKYKQNSRKASLSFTKNNANQLYDHIAKV